MWATRHGAVVPVALAGQSDEVLHAQEVVVELALAELGRVEVERAHLSQQRHTDTEIPVQQQQTCEFIEPRVVGSIYYNFTFNYELCKLLLSLSCFS